MGVLGEEGASPVRGHGEAEKCLVQQEAPFPTTGRMAGVGSGAKKKYFLFLTWPSLQAVPVYL